MECNELVLAQTENESCSQYLDDVDEKAVAEVNYKQNNTDAIESASSFEPSNVDTNNHVEDANCTGDNKHINGSASEELVPINSDYNADLNHDKSVEKVTTKGQRKEARDLRNLLKTLQNCTAEEKLEALYVHYEEVTKENKQLKATIKRNEKQIANMTKNCDQLRTDLNKSSQTRNTLENLCRELQRQNKSIQEESLRKILEGEQKRKEITEKFQGTVNEITALMKKDSEKTTKLFNENIEMSAKLKSIKEQYNLREQQIEGMMKQLTLETQLHEAKVAKIKMETDAEKEILLREKQQLLVSLTEYQARCKEYQDIELALRSQIAIYTNKYDEFQNALTHSNQVFAEFKKEMDSMSKKIIRLESETATWKQRWENAQQGLIEMTDSKKKAEQDMNIIAKQMTALHKLCRTLQNERALLLKRLAHFDPSLNYKPEELSEKLQQSDTEKDRTKEPINEMSAKKAKQDSSLPKAENTVATNDSFVIEGGDKNLKSPNARNKKKSRSNRNKNRSEVTDDQKVTEVKKDEVDAMAACNETNYRSTIVPDAADAIRKETPNPSSSLIACENKDELTGNSVSEAEEIFFRTNGQNDQLLLTKTTNDEISQTDEINDTEVKDLIAKENEETFSTERHLKCEMPDLSKDDGKLASDRQPEIETAKGKEPCSDNMFPVNDNLSSSNKQTGETIPKNNDDINRQTDKIIDTDTKELITVSNERNLGCDIVSDLSKDDDKIAPDQQSKIKTVEEKEFRSDDTFDSIKVSVSPSNRQTEEMVCENNDNINIGNGNTKKSVTEQKKTKDKKKK